MNTVWTNPKFRAGWKSFERMLRRKLNAVQNSHSVNDDYGWTRLFEDSLERLERMRVSGLTSDVFETHRSVIVRIHLPQYAAEHRPNISVSPREITISGIPGKMDEKIKLPCIVTPGRNKAALSKGILEIRLRKRVVDKRAKTYKLHVERSKF
ncbi:Hsp20/alpha crystallin family protein [Paenibacillus alkalitolerans]|uniref:Hsp20/alpha crystallin family protein n=1 Tax=Paenibacillus alkalitolerans TaxID=2799335 RepID=UPI0018F5746C|nr:Hsp20/alpha crystallin family protein [Paenibacillus alkalitolerans]